MGERRDELRGARARARLAPERESQAALRRRRAGARHRGRGGLSGRDGRAPRGARACWSTASRRCPGRDDVVGRLAGAGGGRSLILNGHVDVVPAGDASAWPHDPWGGELDGDRLWGRGACDMKGGIACGIVALRALQELGVRLAGDVVFQSVVDEETGGPGTRAALARGHVADAAIVLEPTAREIVTVEGGLEWVRVVVRGRTGHSAIRYRSVHAGGRGEAVSAIEKAVKLLAAVGELERHWAVHKVHPLMPRGITTINPGVIAGGSGGGADGMPNGMVAVLELLRLLRARPLAQVPARRARRRRQGRVRAVRRPRRRRRSLVARASARDRVGHRRRLVPAQRGALGPSARDGARRAPSGRSPASRDWPASRPSPTSPGWPRPAYRPCSTAQVTSPRPTPRPSTSGWTSCSRSPRSWRSRSATWCGVA